MERHEKSWGYEIWFQNNDEYCGKMLFVEKDKWSSEGAYHFHIKKHETFFIVEGILIVDYVDGDAFKRLYLHPNDSFAVPRQMKHRFTSLTEEGCKFIEASTPHSNDDSYRVNWNEDEQKWVPK